MAKYQPDEITYELFGIDPAEFYESKFACGPGAIDAFRDPSNHYELTFEKVRRLISDLTALIPRGGKVLDVGCGAAPYGPTLIANVPGIVLYGVDMSQTCLEQARNNGFSECRRIDFTRPLPFDDEYFDVVMSMDVLGHVEFRHKDSLISEMARVTKIGGAGHHGVETGYIDYFNCEPFNPDDVVRRYVYVDGHIGVEPAGKLCKRFSRFFGKVSHHMTYLLPFVHKGGLAEVFGEDFGEVIVQYDSPQAVRLANIILGRLNLHFKDEYERIFGSSCAPNDPTSELSEDHREAKDKLLSLVTEHNDTFGIDFIPVPRELFRPAGFSSVTLKKVSAKTVGVGSNGKQSGELRLNTISQRFPQPEQLQAMQDRGVDGRSELEAYKRIARSISARLAAKESELERITNSKGWRLLCMYWSFRHRYLLPIYRLIRPSSGNGLSVSKK